MLEADYHSDSTWPNSQAVIEQLVGALPLDEIRAMTHRNAAELYRHPLPAVCLP
jgi:hypothetical protein